MSPERDSSFDQRFRDALGDFEAPYEPGDWNALQDRLDAPARRRRRAVWIALPSLAALTALGVWWLAQPDWNAVPGYHNPALAEQAAAEIPEASGEGAPGTVISEAPGAQGPEASDAEAPAAMAQSPGLAENPGTRPAPSNGPGAQPANAATAQSPGAQPANAATAQSRNAQPANAATCAKAPARSPQMQPPRKAPAAARKCSHPQSPGAQPANAATAQSRNAQPANAATAQSPGAQPANAATAQSPGAQSTTPDAAPNRAASGGDLNGSTAGNRLPTASLLPEAKAALLPAASLLDPIAARSGWSQPDDRGDYWVEADPTLPRGKRLSGWALSGALGGNAEYTGAGDGIRPGWDASLGAEAWFRSGVLLQAGLRYGHYHFHQSKVGCGNPVAHGLKEPVHCPDAMLGNQARWEVPVQVGYGWDMAQQRGRLRVFGGLTLQKVRSESYEVEFHQPQPGVLLYYEPVAIALIGPPPEVVSFDAAGLVQSSSQFTAQVVGSEERLLPRSLNMAAEFGLGYEQFLAPAISLGAEPHFGVPFQRLEMGGARAYYGGVTARLRWYPGLSR
jgi:hypothetical protein